VAKSISCSLFSQANKKMQPVKKTALNFIYFVLKIILNPDELELSHHHLCGVPQP